MARFVGRSDHIPWTRGGVSATIGGMLRTALAVSLGCCVAAAPATAAAFCGFYVNSAGGTLTNRATTVVLMREGTRTVLSMQNDYDGPPQDFALVVPVPVVLRRGDVRRGGCHPNGRSPSSC